MSVSRAPVAPSAGGERERECWAEGTVGGTSLTAFASLKTGEACNQEGAYGLGSRTLQYGGLSLCFARRYQCIPS